jgi:hypothetical protein
MFVLTKSARFEIDMPETERVQIIVALFIIRST